MFQRRFREQAENQGSGVCRVTENAHSVSKGRQMVMGDARRRSTASSVTAKCKVCKSWCKHVHIPAAITTNMALPCLLDILLCDAPLAIADSVVDAAAAAVADCLTVSAYCGDAPHVSGGEGTPVPTTFVPMPPPTEGRNSLFLRCVGFGFRTKAAGLPAFLNPVTGALCA